jgi:hypothetical protein
MKIISGHQPAYLPWLGYFHKLSLCDVFVYMDTVQFLDRGYNHRNKIRTPQGWTWLTVSIDRKGSDYIALNKIRTKSQDSKNDRNHWQKKHWNAIISNYSRTPYFNRYAKDLERIYLEHIWTHLIDLCWAQFQLFIDWLEMKSKKIVRMSKTIFLGKKDKLILEQCLKIKGDGVVFGELGRNYVDPLLFKQNGIKIYFQKYQHPKYQQRFYGFEPYMSILDLLMNHGPDSKNILMKNNITIDNLKDGKRWL